MTSCGVLADKIILAACFVSVSDYPTSRCLIANINVQRRLSYTSLTGDNLFIHRSPSSAVLAYVSGKFFLLRAMEIIFVSFHSSDDDGIFCFAAILRLIEPFSIFRNEL